MSEKSALERVLQQDRYIVIAALVGVVLLSWIYILSGAGMGMSAFDMTSLNLSDDRAMPMDMPSMEGSMPAKDMHQAQSGTQMDMMTMAIWTPGYGTLMFFMWWVMMVAMMLPSAGPMILLFAMVTRKNKIQGLPYAPTGIFAGGYLFAWGAFSLLATLVQWGLESEGFLSTMMASNSTFLGAFLLLSAGVYQLTPLKHTCLKHCRQPVHFLTRHWHNGISGAFRMGVHHGIFCLACCWFLMGLLFVGGVMNLYWIAGLAIFVLLEKTLPSGHRLGNITGVGLILWGTWMVVGEFWG